jgi:hypothetical protein
LLGASNNACQFGPEKTRLLGKGNSVFAQMSPVAGKARLATCSRVLEECLMSGQDYIVAAKEADGLFLGKFTGNFSFFMEVIWHEIFDT